MTSPCTSSGIRRGVLVLVVMATAAACGNQPQTAPPAATAAPTSSPADAVPTPAAAPAAADGRIADTASPYDALPEGVRALVDKPFTGDFDEMIKHRTIRVGVTFNRTHYFIDRGQERGITYEALKAFCEPDDKVVRE